MFKLILIIKITAKIRLLKKMSRLLFPKPLKLLIN